MRISDWSSDVCSSDLIGDQLGRNGSARPGLPVLPCIAEIGEDSRDPPRRRAFQRIDADKQLHQIVIGRIGRRLEHEHILAANILRSEEHTSELQSLMRISYAVFCLKKNNKNIKTN